ncbi:MAG: protein-L-isoaspartate(D-aspartate) O-methyltransferase [Myxococcota bacterium]
MDETEHARLREEMVCEQLERRGIRDPRVLAAMRRVPRHLFVPEAVRSRAYRDYPIGIGHGQTISQPYIVALMTELGQAARARRVLDVGTGCGYQAAVLAEIVPEVYSIEVIPDLAEAASKRLARLACEQVRVRCGDGRLGWPEAAPFDLILVACAPAAPPPELIEQLSEGGRLVLPVGSLPFQELLCLEKLPGGELHATHAGAVAFVPMVSGPCGEEL